LIRGLLLYPKTELSHYCMIRDRTPIFSAPVCLHGSLFHPSSPVCWLYYWFTPSRDATSHFIKCLALAQGASGKINPASDPRTSRPDLSDIIFASPASCESWAD